MDMASTPRHHGWLLYALLTLPGCGGSGSSQPAPAPPPVTAAAITAQPTATAVTVGATASFSVTASGTAPLNYQWQLSTNAGLTWASATGAATASSYTTPATTLAFNGYRYRVQVSNATGTATSSEALLTVNPPASAERQVNATATDPSITAAPAGSEAPHVAINPSPSVSAQGRLLVFLPGTQGRPSQYTHILRAAASRGFHAVGVNYQNQTAMGALCQFSTDADCYWNARNAVIFGGGTPVSGQTPVTGADSIVNRLNKLLASLNASHPAEGWGQFLLANGTADWSKVVLAGHSQGGGHVGVLAKTVSLGRAVYFSSPEDWNELTDRPANWTQARPNVTPSSRQFGFGSDADTLVPNSHAFAHWSSLGMFRPAAGPVLVDGTSAPFADSQQLRTALPPNPASTAATPALRNHGVTVVDTSTPVDAAGKPLFDTNGVWAYLCFR
jgi:hypothetical protein